MNVIKNGFRNAQQTLNFRGLFFRNNSKNKVHIHPLPLHKNVQQIVSFSFFFFDARRKKRRDSDQ